MGDQVVEFIKLKIIRYPKSSFSNRAFRGSNSSYAKNLNNTTREYKIK